MKQTFCDTILLCVFKKIDVGYYNLHIVAFDKFI